MNSQKSRDLRPSISQGGKVLSRQSLKILLSSELQSLQKSLCQTSYSHPLLTKSCQHLEPSLPLLFRSRRNDSNAHGSKSDMPRPAAGSVDGWFILSWQTPKQEDASEAFIKKLKNKQRNPNQGKTEIHKRKQ